MEELVTAVITTYGRKFSILENAIESVINQTYKSIEIIVVNDNKDEEIKKEIRDNIANKYNSIKYIENAKNLGPQRSRNIGIKASNAAYIAFLDDDDTWLKEKISKQMKVFSDNKEINLGMIYCNGYKVYSKDGKKEEYYNVKFNDKIVTFIDMLEKDYVGSTSQALVRRDVFENVRLF